MNRQQRRRGGKPRGMSYADQLAMKRVRIEATHQAAHSAMVQIQSDIRVQRAMWLMCVAMNDAFGIGPDRFRQFAEKLQERTEWFKKMFERLTKNMLTKSYGRKRSGAVELKLNISTRLKCWLQRDFTKMIKSIIWLWRRSMGMIDTIRTALPEGELLAQLAEEAAELAQAALKLRRCITGINPTPTPKEKAEANLIEELADVRLCAEVLDRGTKVINQIDGIAASKLGRWAKRLDEVRE